MERARVLRFLRIAVTAMSLTACVLLSALWVRSYYKTDLLAGPWFNQHTFNLASMRGGVGLAISSGGNIPHLRLMRNPPEEIFANPEYASYFGFRNSSGPRGRIIRLPYWFCICVTVLFASILWVSRLKWRFSLRTLLIATTLVAVGMGMVVALS